MTSLPASARRPVLRLVAGDHAGADRLLGVTDEDIIAAFGRRDPRFGRELYDRVSSVVEGTLYRMLGRYEPDHEDLVQAAFEQIVTTLVRRRFARACSLRSWAAAVTTNVALNALRRRGTERKVFDRSLDGGAAAADRPGAGTPERQAVAQQQLDGLRHKLGQLPQKLAQTVLLYEAFGYDVAEIAALTGVSISAAQSRLVRGRRKLAELLERDRSEEQP